MNQKLTIIIPCKNEENYIGHCLTSISQQIGSEQVEIIIADAHSTDQTLNIIHSFPHLKITVIPGGLPAVGRNLGATLATTPYLLFLDADAVLKDKNILQKSLSLMENHDLDLVGVYLNSQQWVAKTLYFFNNIFMWLSQFEQPFAVGIYFLMRKDTFHQLGGFSEKARHCEDYLLSKQVPTRKFKVLNSYVYSDNRRFKKMGYLNMIGYIFKNITQRNNPDYFSQDINYWQ